MIDYAYFLFVKIHTKDNQKLDIKNINNKENRYKIMYFLIRYYEKCSNHFTVR